VVTTCPPSEPNAKRLTRTQHHTHTRGQFRARHFKSIFVGAATEKLYHRPRPNEKEPHFPPAHNRCGHRPSREPVKNVWVRTPPSRRKIAKSFHTTLSTGKAARDAAMKLLVAACNAVDVLSAALHCAYRDSFSIFASLRQSCCRLAICTDESRQIPSIAPISRIVFRAGPSLPARPPERLSLP